MSLRKLTAGDGYSYLTRQVAAHDSTEKGHTSLADYYDEKGESPGRWMGAGLGGLDMAAGETVTAAQMKALFGLGIHPNAGAMEEAIAERGGTRAEVEGAVALGKRFLVHTTSSPFNMRVAEAFTAYNLELRQRWNAPIRPEERARIRTEIATAMFAEQHGREAQDARELSGFIAKASRQPTSAIAGFDLTFSPVKSVSALWALAPREVAEAIRAAHEAAVAETLSWLEREVAHTRVGRAGARQVKVRGLVAAAFTHRDSRAGDPDLHTHVAVSNKVQSEDGRWLALDGRLLYAAKVAASEHYNTRIEAELVDRLGVEFVERAEPSSTKLPVREIRGVSTTLTRWWSRRRVAIEARQAEIAAEFQQRFGRPPTAIEATALADQATLETRDAKHGHRSERDQRAIWRAEADDVLGDPAEVDEMYAHTLRRGNAGQAITRPWVEDAAAATIGAVEESRATWNVWHLFAEAQRQARRAGIARDSLELAVSEVVRAAISRSVRLGVDDPITEPAPLHRPDGASVYDVHGATLYTSAKVLSAEQELVALAARHGAHTLSGARVEAAITASAAKGIELNDAQAAMVRDLSTSGAAVQLALAPAGTGKTTTMSVLADAWTQAGGTVIGLAPSAQAAHELGQAITGHTDTLAKLTWTLAHEPETEWPRWIREIGPQTMVILDEAGQAATTELATAARFVARRGGVVRLVGDDQQLAAVGAGGVLRDIQREFGAATLSEVRRFEDPAEAAATLAVRDGDPAAVGFYADEGRIHVGDLSATADQAYDAWARDRAAGLDSVLLAPTRELVGQLNARARADRLRTVVNHGLDVDLADGNLASAGELIVTRRNSRRLVISQNNWVKNGDRWHVEEVREDGSMLARHVELGRAVLLSPDYVAEHVQLGYATTVHGAQGMTADTAHLVATGEETRQTLYVGISRGRRANHIYLATGFDGDPHSLIDPKALRPPTALDVMADILRRDGSDVSATSTQSEASSPSTQLHDAVIRYCDALGFAAEDLLGSQTLAAADRDIEAIWPGLTRESAYPALRADLALRALDGDDPIAVLLDAAGSGELTTSNDRAAVLAWRLGKRPSDGPLPWLDSVPARLHDHATWGQYLRGRAARVAGLAGAVEAEASAWTPAATPAWASGLTGAEHAALRADVAVWRAAFAVTEHDSRATGPRQAGMLAMSYQGGLERRVTSVLGVHSADEDVIGRLPDEVRRDPGFARLSERLGALQTAQIDVDSLLARALEGAHPLPDERAADALWWRIVRHLGPAALRASAEQAHTLRPAWTTFLCERLGRVVGERVMADAMWPALVAAVHACPSEWTAEQLLEAATSGRGSDVRPEELCSTLVWRVATMTDAPFDEPDPWEPDVAPAGPAPSAAPVSAESSTPVHRIIELNKSALDFYVSRFPSSWAPDYLRERLDTDLAEDDRFHLGYAPPGPRSLTQHLMARGASIDELVDAGLARLNERGGVLDVFRDRLVFPIRSESDIVGFVGRRNPSKGHPDFAGPKYLNTRGTATFTKGAELFGLDEVAAELAAGAVPVLVEGPMDALAVTLASAGAYVGIAPLGTAFTDAQAAKLKSYVRDGRDIVIATDPDSAGWQSAQRAFWRLAALRANPRHLTLPDDVDPAEVLRAEGPEALAGRLTESTPLADLLIDRRIEERLSVRSDPFARVDMCREVARIIGALPPEEWLALAQHVSERIDLSLAIVHEEIIEAGTKWTDEPQACVTRELAQMTAGSPAKTFPPRPEMGSTAPNADTYTAIAPPASRAIDR